MQKQLLVKETQGTDYKGLKFWLFWVLTFWKVIQLLRGFVLVFASRRVDECIFIYVQFFWYGKLEIHNLLERLGFRTEVRIWYWHGGRSRGLPELPQGRAPRQQRRQGQSHLGQGRQPASHRDGASAATFRANAT